MCNKGHTLITALAHGCHLFHPNASITLQHFAALQIQTLAVDSGLV